MTIFGSDYPITTTADGFMDLDLSQTITETPLVVLYRVIGKCFSRKGKIWWFKGAGTSLPDSKGADIDNAWLGNLAAEFVENATSDPQVQSATASATNLNGVVTVSMTIKIAGLTFTPNISLGPNGASLSGV